MRWIMPVLTLIFFPIAAYSADEPPPEPGNSGKTAGKKVVEPENSAEEQPPAPQSPLSPAEPGKTQPTEPAKVNGRDIPVRLTKREPKTNEQPKVKEKQPEPKQKERPAAVGAAGVSSGRIARTEADVAAALDRIVTVDYCEATVEEIILDLSERSGVNMVIGREVDRDNKLTLQLKEQSLASVLRWVAELSGNHLSYRNGAILLGTEKDQRVVTAVYPIADLLLPMKSRHPPGMDEEDHWDEEEDDADEERQRLLDFIDRFIESEE